MTSRKEISDLTLRFQARTLNIYRKLFFDLQEREYSVELRDRAAKLEKQLKKKITPKQKARLTTSPIFSNFASRQTLFFPPFIRDLPLTA